MTDLQCVLHKLISCCLLANPSSHPLFEEEIDSIWVSASCKYL